MHTNCVKSLPHLRERLLHSGGVARTFAFVSMSLVLSCRGKCPGGFVTCAKRPGLLPESLLQCDEGA
jgi:hypothetical protein